MPAAAEVYRPFLDSPCARAWRKVGVRRRSAAATPLFSVWSEKSAGVGELPDLVLLADWCRAGGISIIQLLPMNDIGFTFRPYDAESCFALEPMHLSLEALEGVDARPWKRSLAALREKFPAGSRTRHFDTRIKQAKLDLLSEIYAAQPPAKARGFREFQERNESWLGPYAAFKLLKEKMDFRSWETWPEEYRRGVPHAPFTGADLERAGFHRWLQWQLYEQFKRARAACAERGVLLMGDLPLLVSRDSADVWSRQDRFKLGLAAGAPPDALFAGGQQWGMPPYDWERIASEGYTYLIERLRYAENFYDLFRIDHFVGLFRLWSFPAAGGEGFFDPPDESVWEEHGRRILTTIVANTSMLPCAEDLGTVPECSQKLLREFAVPGMDVQRWSKNWDTGKFTDPAGYRANSMATVSTHDLTSLTAWWEFEAGTVDEVVFRKKCESQAIAYDAARAALFDERRSAHGRLRWKSSVSDARLLAAAVGRSEHETADLAELHRQTFDEREEFWAYVDLEGAPSVRGGPAFVTAALGKANASASVFTSQLLQDWLSLGRDLAGEDPWNFRINFPGTTSEKNWTLTMPFSLERMKKLTINRKIRTINETTGRAGDTADHPRGEKK